MPSSSTSSTTSNVSPTSSAILSSSGKLSLSSSDIISSSPQHIYKLSSQYFLTKHFPEAANAITPLLKSQETRWKQKAWGLYLIILDNGLKFSDEQGRKVWGRQAWEKEVARVKESKLWDDLVESVGDISVVEAEVMMAMIQVSLHHGDTKVAQMKVEEWLAAVNPPDELENLHLDNGATNGDTKEQSKKKDVYGKVLELYCLFLLSRNEEWEYAKSFISGNFYLSENKKRIYISKLDDLKLAREQEKNKPKISPPAPSAPTPSPPKKTTTTKSQTTISGSTSSSSAPSPSYERTPSIPSSNTTPTPHTLSTLANRLLRNPSRYLQQFYSLLHELSRDDSFLRTLLFILAFTLALLRRDVRTRVKLAGSWLYKKIRETISMGGKVGYV